MKNPFYFAVNQIPLELKDVKFNQHKFNDNFIMPYTEGYLKELDLNEFIPTFEDKIGDVDFCLNDLLSNSYETIDNDSTIIQLSVLSQLFKLGSVFLYKKNETKVFSTMLSMEMHYFIEEKIAAIDNFQSEWAQSLVGQSCFNVASMIRGKDIFQDKDFLDKDEEDAYQYYHRAATLKNPDALYVLAVIFYEAGEFDECFKLFIRSAVYGNVNSQFNLMNFYINGEIVEKDIGMAYFWGMVASNNGDQKAKEAVEKNIILRLSPKSIDDWNKKVSLFEKAPEEFYKGFIENFEPKKN